MFKFLFFEYHVFMIDEPIIENKLYLSNIQILIIMTNLVNNNTFLNLNLCKLLS